MVAEAWQIWLAFNVGLALVLLLRSIWHRSGAPASAYALWLLPPLLAVAVSLPRLDAVPTLMIPIANQVSIPTAAVQVSTGWSLGLICCVIAQVGSALMFLSLLIRQLRFERGLHAAPKTSHPAWPEASIVCGRVGPAVSGWWRPRLILPADFDTRFSPKQQALAIAHEQAHWRAGDLRVRTVAWLLLALQWWNPLAWWALRCFVNDQELANDARVLRQFPDAQLDYAHTLALAQDSAKAPLVCAMQTTHPLLWRVTMLKNHVGKKSLQRRMGVLTALTLSSLTGFVMALDTKAPPIPENPYTVLVDAQFAGAEHASFAVAGPMGETMSARIGEGEEAFLLDITVTKTADPAVVLLSTKLRQGAETLAAPTLLLPLGQAGAASSAPEAGQNASPWQMKLTVQKGMPGETLNTVEPDPSLKESASAKGLVQPWQAGLAWTRSQDPDC